MNMTVYKYYRLSISGKRQDPVKQAVHGLLKLDDVSDESTSRVSEYSHSISEGQHRMGCFAEVCSLELIETTSICM